MITREAQEALDLMVVRAEIVLKQFEAHNDRTTYPCGGP